MIRQTLLCIGSAIALSACTPPPSVEAEGQIPGSSDVVMNLGEITTDASGRCFAVTAAPTQTRVVERLVEVAPERRAADGTVLSPAVFREVAGPEPVTTGEGRRFETVCPQIYTAEFVATLQRALAARDAYDGPISGLYDPATSGAVRLFQQREQIDSPLLAMSVARMLGIVAVPRDG